MRLPVNGILQGVAGNIKKTDDIDLGFTRDAGHYVFAGDWYGIKDIKQDYLTQALAQRYA